MSVPPCSRTCALRSLVLCAGLLCWSLPAHAASSSATSPLVDAPASVSSSADVQAVYEAQHIFELDRKRDGRYELQEEVRVRYAPLTERGALASDVFVYEQFFAPVEKLKAKVNRRTVEQDRHGEYRPEFEDVFLSSGFAHTVRLADTVEPGDQVTYSYERTYVEPAYLPVLYVPNADSLHAFEVVVKHPVDVAVQFDVFVPGDGIVYEVEPGERTTRLQFQGRGRAQDLDFAPHGGYHAAVLMTLTGPDGPINPVSPEAFGAWYTQLVTVPMSGADLDAQAEALRQDTDLATVKALYDHVRSTVRYIADERGEHAFVPRPPARTLANGFGDCKDKAFLIRALAASLGIDVHTVLVATTPQPEFAGTSFGLYNHVIAAYDDAEGRRHFFDPTAQHAPFEALPEYLVGTQALVMGDATTERVRIPSAPRAPYVEVAFTGALDQPESAIATVTLRGGYFEEVQRLRQATSPLDLENMLSASVGALFYNLAFDRFIPVDEDATSVTFRADADLSDWIVASPTRRYLPQAPFRVFARELLDREDDALPVAVSMRPYAQATLDLDAPGWAAAPDSSRMVAASSDGSQTFGTFTSEVTQPEPGRLRAEYRLAVEAKRFAGADKAPFLAFVRDYLGARRAVFTLRAAPDAVPIPDAAPSSDDVAPGSTGSGTSPSGTPR
ncbi:MAG: transglutaminase domain-containing protein [Bacteroidota bacterium]